LVRPGRPPACAHPPSPQVYATLAVTLAVAALGCYVNILTGIGGVLGMLGCIGCAIALGAVPASPATTRKRQALLAGAAFSQGTCLGPIVNITLAIHPG
jgi:FtsH-binding integral membrane protein